MVECPKSCALWFLERQRGAYPTPAELAESVAALRAAYADMEAGDSGRPARAALREMCERLGLVLGE